MLKGVKSIHFIGIAGVGMSGLAKVLSEKGYRVSGSDIKKNVFTEQLEKRGVTVYQGHSPSHLNQADLVITSSVISPDNPELQIAKRKRIRTVSRGALLAELVNRKKGIVVAGTHGKTTTSSLIYSILRQAGKDPTMFIGGEVNDLGGNSKLGSSEYVVAESDESDGSFLLLSPSTSILTNIEDDHIDYYGSKDKLVQAFVQFTGRLKPAGTLIINIDDPCLSNVIKNISLSPSQRLITYGISPMADFSAKKIKLKQFSSSYQIDYQGKKIEDIDLSLPGQHNIYNSLAGVAAGLDIGIGWEEIKKALLLFSGVKRRFELIGEKSGILVIDDYAHHPTEIKVTLEVAARLERRTIAIFQPHRYTRTKMLLSKFGTAFEKADILLLTNIYAAGENPIPGMDGELLFERVKQKRRKATYYFTNFRKIIDFLGCECREGDLILTLGAGNINKVGRSFLNRE
jgi:UDP-N-acetylmuramate--alanine ligase